MPCTYTGSIEGDRALASSEKLTEVTDMLCRTLQVFEEICNKNEGVLSFDSLLGKDITKFWDEHKKLDKLYKEAELLNAKRKREAVLEKLTPEEIKLLGIKI